MITVANLLKKKGSEIFSVSPDTQTFDAIKMMAEKRIGALLVMEGGKLEGIISERDFVRQIAKVGACNIHAPVKEFMTRTVFYVVPTVTTDECMALMTEKHIRHLPVLDAGKVVGVISITDVVKQVVSDQASTIAGLENFITGRDYMQ
jgi:CBS domain-containing protein